MTAPTPHQPHAQTLVDAAIAAADPYWLVRQALALRPDGLVVAGTHHAPARSFVLAVGKAAAAMATAAAAVLGARLTAGVVIGKQPTAHVPPPLNYHAGNHPLPGADSLRATRAALDLLADARPDDLLLCLLSGGADGCTVIAFATDGDDGVHPPGSAPMAGAVVSGATVAAERRRGLDAAAYLAANDSYRFFQAAGSGHLSGRLGTNVNDVLILLRYPRLW